MKNFAILCLALALVILAAPVAVLGETHSESVTVPRSTVSTATDSYAEPEAVKVFRTLSGKVEELEAYEYVLGSVAAEMSAGCECEALKAQAVASYTYALRAKQKQLEKPSEALCGAYLSDDSSHHQSYMNEDERRELWGESFDEYEKKLGECVREVLGLAIYHDDKPILAAYHSVNTGRTESAENVWGGEISYLVSVTSAGDRLSPDYESTVRLTAEEFKNAMYDKAGVKLKGDAEDWLGESETTDAGTVLEIKIGGESLDGSEVRDALELKSLAFKIVYADGGFEITARGWGHGVGMSQYGADYMARQGSTFKEILKHYYTDIEIK